jgi:hypothetical protein
VSFEARLTTSLIDEQRGSQTADHDEVVHEVAQLGGDVETGRTNEREVLPTVTSCRRGLSVIGPPLQ